MRVKVTASLTIGYGGEYHGKGAEFSVLPDDLLQLAGLVEVTEEVEEPEADETEEDADEMTVAQLKASLDGLGIEYPKRAKRDELIALLPD